MKLKSGEKMSFLNRPLLEMKIAVIGLGYVGLPTAIALHNSGFQVSGVDISEGVVNKIRLGESPLMDSSSNLKIPVESERWSVTTKFEDSVPDSDVVLITVPTPVKSDNSPDLSFVEGAFESVLRNLGKTKNKIVVLESTVFPGVTTEISSKMASEIGLKVGEDFHIAYSPERVSPGEEGKTVEKISKIVGAEDPEIGIMLEGLYSEMTDGGCVFVGSTAVAEAAKLIENVQRDVDIALANEFANVLSEMGLDADAVLSASSSKWSFHRHYPGIGVGGHCIPVDPYYYIQCAANMGVPSSIAPVARLINERMPVLSAKKVLDGIGGKENPKILILGFSYKPELGDCRMTPVLPLVNELSKKTNDILIWDPHVDERDFPNGFKRIEDPESVENLDAVILATAHSACIGIDWNILKRNCDPAFLFDGRRSLDPERMKSMGWKYSGVGYPG